MSRIEAVAAEGSEEDPKAVPSQKPKRKQGKRKEDLEALFGEGGWKQLPDEVYCRYGFIPAKVEVEEHHVKVYVGKNTDDIVRTPHPGSLLRGSLVSPSLEAAVMNAKYVNAVLLYR